MTKRVVNLMGRSARWLCVLCLFALVACERVPVAQDLSQKQANTIVAFLAGQGIPAQAEKQTGGKSAFRVLVKSDLYGRSISLMNERGLPGDQRPSFDELIQQKGLIPDSRAMEQLRINRALALQVEEILSLHPGVRDVRVAVHRIQKDEEDASRVSVMLTTDPKGKAPILSDLRSLVLKTVPGITEEDISIVMEKPAEQKLPAGVGGVYQDESGVLRVPLVPFLVFWHVPESEYISFVFLFCGLFVVILLVAISFGYWFGRWRQGESLRKHFAPQLPRPQTSSFQLESKRPELPED